MQPGSTIRNLAVGFGYFFVFMLVMRALGGAADDTESAETGVEADEEEHTVLITVLDETGEPVATADVEFIHSDGFWSTDAENRQTDSDGTTAFETEHQNDVEILVNASGYKQVDSSLTVVEDEEVTVTLQEEAADVETNESDVADPEADAESAAEDAEDTDAADVPDEQLIDEAEGDFSDDDIMTLMEFTLEDHVHEVDSIGVENGVSTIEYTSVATSEDELLGEVGAAGGVYAGGVDQGLASDTVVIEIYALDGTHVATTERDADLAQTFVDSNNQDEEFVLQLVLNFESHVRFVRPSSGFRTFDSSGDWYLLFRIKTIN